MLDTSTIAVLIVEDDERLASLTKDYLERQVHQDVAEFGLDAIGVLDTDGLVQLHCFFDQIRAQRERGLCSVPRAPLTEISHEFDDSSKR